MGLIARPLNVNSGQRYPLDPMSPQRQRCKLFEALFQLLSTLTARRSGLIVVEDLHWMDPSSDEFVGRLIEGIRSLPVLVVLTTRSEFQSHWEDLDKVEYIILKPLNRMESEQLIAEVSDHGKLPANIVTRIADKSDGIPLFIEDVTLSLARTVDERGSGGQKKLPPLLADLEIPDTLHDSLMSRLDRLGREAKRIVQIGATIGREFAYQLLVEVSKTENQSIKDILVQLEQADVLHARRTPLALIYVFKHALVQDVAYASLLKRERRQLHLRVAQVLEDAYPETCSQAPELLALHYEEAGEIFLAVDYWLAAGRREAKRSNYVKAIGLLDRSLSLARRLPTSDVRARRELDIFLAIGVAQAGYRGISAPESGEAYKRALEICRGLNNPAEIFSVISGAGAFHITRAEFETCRSLADECLGLAREQPSGPPFVMGHRLLGGCPRID